MLWLIGSILQHMHILAQQQQKEDGICGLPMI